MVKAFSLRSNVIDGNDALSGSSPGLCIIPLHHPPFFSNEKGEQIVKGNEVETVAVRPPSYVNINLFLLRHGLAILFDY